MYCICDHFRLNQLRVQFVMLTPRVLYHQP